MASRRAALLALLGIACGKVASNPLTTDGDATATKDSATPSDSPRAIDADVGDCDGGQPFADPIVEAAVRRAVGKRDGRLSRQDLAGVTALRTEAGVTTLAGVECLTSLESISAADGAVSDLSPLKDLGSLRTLYLQYNRIESLRPLDGHPLRTVVVHDNRIESLDGLLLPQGSCNHLLNLVRNPVDRADVDPFCVLDWVVVWGGEGDGDSVQCNAICL